MHRHGYRGRKFGRERDQRTALMRGLAVSLVEHGSIETTLPKAKELRPMIEKLVSKAKKADLHNRRQIISSLNSKPAGHKLVEQIAPAMQRTSGYTRIQRTALRRGDNVQLARISFVDKLEQTVTEAKAPKTASAKDIQTPATPKTATQNRPGDSQKTSAAPTATNQAAAPRRTGRRGNR